MHDPEALSFSPHWYQIGDSDIPGIALAYGIITMVTVWLVESLAHRVLFTSKNFNFTLSEASALVTFKGCSWLELFYWSTSGTWMGVKAQNPQRNFRMLNLRALTGIALRSLVILLEVFVIFASIPRKNYITEDEVGSSQLMFNRDGEKLIQNESDSKIRLYMSPCFKDPIPYTGFAPTAFRQVCYIVVHAGSMPGRINPPTKLLATANQTGENILWLWTNSQKDALVLYSFTEKMYWFLSHTIILEGDHESSSSDDSTYYLPLPDDIIDQARTAFVRSKGYEGLCRTAPGLARSSKYAFILCKDDGKSSFLAGPMIQNSFLSMYFKKVPAKKSKRSIRRKVHAQFLVVGGVNRPRMCIFPALILILILGAIDVVILLVFGSDNIIPKLFHLAKEAAGADCMSNPIYAEMKDIPFRKRMCNGTLHIGYLRRVSTIEDFNQAAPVTGNHVLPSSTIVEDSFPPRSVLAT